MIKTSWYTREFGYPVPGACYTDDVLRLTSKELAEFKQINAEGRKKIPCTLRISKKSLEWWKSLGDGYTAAMARMLEDAQNHPDILREII